jgi:hypothetical protein
LKIDFGQFCASFDLHSLSTNDNRFLSLPLPSRQYSEEYQHTRFMYPTT